VVVIQQLVKCFRCNTTADNNTAVGFNSLCANTTGTTNTAVGYSALYQIQQDVKMLSVGILLSQIIHRVQKILL
jgi:hypothetical protein